MKSSEMRGVVGVVRLKRLEPVEKGRGASLSMSHAYA